MKRTLLSLAFFLVLWELAARMIHLSFFPPPEQVFLEMVMNFRSNDLGIHLGVSLFRVLTALILSFIPAAILGLAAGRNVVADHLISPGVYLLYPIPKVALLPVILLFLGLGNLSKIFFVALLLFFPFFIHIRDGAAGLNRRYFDSLISLGGKKKDILFHILLPALLPRIFTSLRMNLGTAVAVLFLAETFATRKGIGWFIMDAWSRLAYEEMYAAITALSLACLCLFYLVDALEKRFCPWK